MDYIHAHQIIVETLRITSEPLGLALIPNGDPWPEQVSRPVDMGVKTAMCQWTNHARREGAVVGLRADDIACIPCQVAFSLKTLKDPSSMANFLKQMGYVEDPGLFEKMLTQFSPLPLGLYQGIIAFPLNRAPLVPNVVWIYGNPAQMSHMVIALMHEQGRSIPSNTGLGLSCRNGFADDVQIILPGRGERTLGCTGETELFLSLPAIMLKDLIAGLEATKKNGITAPVVGPLPQNMPNIPAMQEMAATVVDPG